MKRLLRTLVVGALSLAPAAALAAIDNTHHDMTRYLANMPKKCAYCHSVQVGTGSANWGSVGSFCLVLCHNNSTTFPNAVPTAPGYFGASSAAFANRYNSTAGTDSANVVAMLGGAHGMDVTALGAGTGGMDAASAVGATGWPHASASADMECTSCHAVHDGGNPPFLNAPLATGTNATAFCQQCHTGAGAAAAGRYQDIATMGAHPTEFAYTDGSVAAGRHANATKLGVAMNIKAAKLNVVSTSAATTIVDFNNDMSGNVWRTGGHFQAANGLPATAATGTTVGCYSCHSAHQNAAGAVGSTLLMAPMNVTSSDAKASSVLCTGCHGAAATWNNPGTTTHYHPTNEETWWDVAPGAMNSVEYRHQHADHAAEDGSSGTENLNIPDTGYFPIRIDWSGVNSNFIGNPTGAAGVGGAVVCVSCHDVHGGVANLMAIRQIPGAAPVSTTQSVCLGCHKESTGTQTGANMHHPGAAAAYAGNWPATLGWETTDGLGDLTDGLSCPDCHVFQGNKTRRATAHNWQ